MPRYNAHMITSVFQNSKHFTCCCQEKENTVSTKAGQNVKKYRLLLFIDMHHWRSYVL